MSQQFRLTWNNTNVAASSNSINQRALYRYKSIGGAFLSDGFTPANDLATSANTTISKALDDNKVIQFEVETICTVNGPAINDNGIVEAIGFSCIAPVITKDYVSSNISIDITGLDITKARFTLRKASDNTLIYQIIVNPIGTTISTNAVGLSSSTNYYWQIELYANVNNIEVISSDSNYLGTPCSPYPFITDAPPYCAPITSMTISSIGS